MTGSNVNTAQNTFGVSVTVAASTVYSFESFYILQKTSGTTSHTIGSTFGGTATLNNITYGITWSRADSALTASAMTQFSASNSFSTSAANLVLTNNITSSNETFVARVTGTVSVDTEGTFSPQYKLSAAPGSAYKTLAGSYFAIWPTGTAGAAISVGPWA